MLIEMKAIGMLALGSLALGSVGLTTGGTTLRRELKLGTKDEYEVRCAMITTPSEGLPGDPKSVKASWDAAYSIEDVDGEKGARLKVEIKNFALVSEGDFVRSNQAKERTVTALLDSRNRVSPISSTDLKPSFTQNWLPTDLLEFPEKELSIGDTWDVTMAPSMVLGNSKLVLPAKLTGEETYEGRNAWVVTIEKKGVARESKMQFRLNGGGETKDGKIVGKLDVSVKILIEKATGRTLLMTGKIRGSQHVELPDIDEQPPTNIDYSATMKLKVPKP
jgi:hypothetical protein